MIPALEPTQGMELVLQGIPIISIFTMLFRESRM